ncbi:sin3 histone deacetylase corepressor complex component SDS3-like [Ornithodoros turicata]|uniref:Putative sin3 histone deacetylase corepressor complex component sds3 n=1 Tax=Ornithodoros turicata TaxID=34597 RepID=A0A2R5L6U3_9ACAR
MFLQDLANCAFMHKDSTNDVDCNDESLDCDNFPEHDERESDEDTEDASETDMVKQEEEYTEIKEQMYRDKLATLKRQLSQLKEDTHPEYLRRLKKIEQVYHERLFLNEVFQTHEIERVEREYINEKKAAVREFEEKKIDLRESLIMELEEKKRMVESERSTIELTGDSMEVKSVTTRKLRRRPNDPLPIPEKRRKTSPTQLNILLDEGDIIDDLRTINKGKLATLHKRTEGDGCLQLYDARIEDGKLFYDKKWYHRGQSVCVESKDTGRFFGIISTFGTSEILIKKSHDNVKVKVHLSQLLRGKVLLRRKST